MQAKNKTKKEKPKLKKKKLSKIPVIHRRIFKFWSEAVRHRSGETCEYCGSKKGDENKSGNPMKIDAHHIMNRDVKDCPLKFDIRNGIALCPSCHKFSPNNAFHTNPVVTVDWLRDNQPEKYLFVKENYELKLDLNNRLILSIIEESLREKKELPLDLLKNIDEKYHSSNFQNELANDLADKYS